jgi:hypothetical protein
MSRIIGGYNVFGFCADPTLIESNHLHSTVSLFSFIDIESMICSTGL